MNTNNKEAIKAFWDDLDKLTFLHDWSLKEKSDIVQLFEAYSTVLQDNEDTEVQKKQKFRLGKDYDLTENLKKASTLNKPSSKVEKLKEFKEQLELSISDYYKDQVDLEDFMELMSILIEDEE